MTKTQLYRDDNISFSWATYLLFLISFTTCVYEIELMLWTCSKIDHVVLALFLRYTKVKHISTECLVYSKLSRKTAELLKLNLKYINQLVV